MLVDRSVEAKGKSSKKICSLTFSGFHDDFHPMGASNPGYKSPEIELTNPTFWGILLGGSSQLGYVVNYLWLVLVP